MFIRLSDDLIMNRKYIEAVMLDRDTRTISIMLPDTQPNPEGEFARYDIEIDDGLNLDQEFDDILDLLND